MCYFVSIGAKVPGHLLAQAFDGPADIDIATSAAGAAVASAFPADDEVSLLTWRGCSCDLIGPRAQGAAAGRSRSNGPRMAFRSGVAKLARELGSVRLLVWRHREPRPVPVVGASITLTTREFLSRDPWFIEDAVVEVSGEHPSEIETAEGHRSEFVT